MTDMDLVDIPTNWSEVIRHQHEDGAIAREAITCMIQRYSRAIQRYVRVFFRDQNNADDVYQKFAVKLASGDLRHASPEKGSFRIYLKAVLRNLIRSHQLEMGQSAAILADPTNGVDPENPMEVGIEEECRIWREEVVGRAWESLEAHEQSHSRDLPYHVLLRYRKEHPDASMSEIASHFSPPSGPAISEAKIRSLLHDARQFLRLRIYAEVAETLAYPTVDNVEQEIIDLGLHKWLAPTIREVRRRR